MTVLYHAHSVWSDGKAGIPEMIRAAADAGFTEFGMSDHYVLTPGREQLDWSMPLDRFDEYVEDVQRSAENAPESLTVRLGVEADFIPETADELRGILATQPLDYVIGSVHLVDGFLLDSNPEDWSPLSQSERDEIIRSYWVRIRRMAESRMFDFAAHLDLYKKFGIRPSVDISREVDAALDAIAASGMAVELNTAGWFWDSMEAYPSPDIIRGCFERGIPTLVNSDAHTPEHVSRAYPRAYRALCEAGYREQAVFAGRQMLMRPIDCTN